MAYPLVTALAADVISKEYAISPLWEKKAEVNLGSFFKDIKRDIDIALLHLHIKYIDKLMKQNLKILELEQSEIELELHQHIHIDLMKQRTELTKKIGTVIVK